MTYVYILQFLGTIIALSGALTVFLVGVVYADLWASYRRTQQLIREHQKESDEEPKSDIDIPIAEDPFEETYDEGE